MKEVIVNGVRWYQHPYSEVWIKKEEENEQD